MTKEVKIPMIVGMILYGIALLIDLIGVLIPDISYFFTGASFRFDGFVFPLDTVFQIIGMIMLIVFYMTMLKYKGANKRSAGIAMIAIYCVINVVFPYIGVFERQIAAQMIGSEYLTAVILLETYIALFTKPFTFVSTVFVIIAIGRYIIINDTNTQYNGWTTEIKEGQQNDQNIH